MSKRELTTLEEMLLEDANGINQEELIIEVTEAMARALRGSGLTQTELAHRLGKSKGFVSQVLGGGKNLTLRTLADVAGALGCKVQVQLKPQVAAQVACISDWNQRPAYDAGAPASASIHEWNLEQLAG